MKKNLSSWIFTGVFIFVVCCLGALSFAKLVNFYVNDEKDYNEWSPNLGSKLETDIASTFYNKFAFINFNGAMRNFLNQYSMNGVIKLNNGYLFTTIDYCSDEKILEYANKTEKLNNYLKRRGTHMVYMATPYTSSKYDPQLPIGVTDFGNDNVDRYINAIKSKGVDVLDIRERMYNDGINQYDMMYRTDHHWNTEAGLYAYGVLEDYIVDKTGCQVDPRVADKENYTITKYEKWHLGSRGQRTGMYFAGIDDFDFIVPNFNTILQDDYGNIGTVQELMFNTTSLSSRDYTSRYTYDSVLGGTVNHYVNLNSYNDLKVLIVSDSFAKAMNQYLAMGMREIKYIYDQDDDELTPEMIEEYDPDIVIMMYYSENFIDNSKTFAFSGF